MNPANHDILALLKATRNGAVYGAKVRFPHALVMTILFRTGSPKAKVLSILSATRQHSTNLAVFAFIYKSLLLVFRGLSTASLGETFTRVRDTADVPQAHGLDRKLTRREASSDAFFAGVVAGYVVFGRRSQAASSVTQQIVIYVFARVVLGLAKLAVAPATAAPSSTLPYSAYNRGGYGLLDFVFGDSTTGRGGLVPGRLSDEAREQWKAGIRRNSWAVFASVSWGMVMWLFRWHPDVLQPSLRSSMQYLYDNAEQWDSFKNWFWHNR